MKRKICSILAFVLGVALCAPVAFKTIDADASAKTVKVLQDTFNDLNYSGRYNNTKWKTYIADEETTEIAQTQASNAVLHFVNGQSSGEALQLATVNRYDNIQSIQFDFKLTSDDNTTWLGVNIVNDAMLDEGLQGNTSIYTVPILIRSPQISANTVTFDKNASWSNLIGTDNIAGEWVTIKIVPDATGRSASVYTAKQGDELPQTANLIMTWNSANSKRSFSEGYVAFGTTHIGLDQYIDNIEIKADGATHSEDFTPGDLSWTEKGIFQKIGPGSAAGLTVYDNSALQFENAKTNDRIISVQSIAADTSVVMDMVALDATFNVKMDAEAALTDEIAFVFGLSEQRSNPLKGSYAYIINKNGGRLEKYTADGKVELSSQNMNRNSFGSITGKNGANIQLTVKKNGEFAVYENGNKIAASFDKVETYAGYFGFVAFSDLSTDVFIDSVGVNSTSYYVPKTKSVTHNFSNDFFGNEGYEDFVTKALPENSLYVNNGKLVMQGASDGTFFGSAHQYDSFIMDYKLCNIYVGTPDMENTQATKEGRWLGFDLSRQTKKISDYGSYLMLYFTIVPSKNATSVSLSAYTKSSSATAADPNSYVISKVRDIPVNYFTDIQYDGVDSQKANIKNSDALCVRWVSENGVLKLYMKKASEADFTLYYTIMGLELNGYFALCNTGFLHAELDDFSMANTSPMYECADSEAPETIIKDKEIYIYDKGNIDVNWEEELVLNASNQGGCGSSIVATECLGLTLAVAALLLKKRRK